MCAQRDQLSRLIIDISSWFQKIQDGRVSTCCRCCYLCCCYQFLAPLDNFKMFDDVMPSPHLIRCYWKHLFRDIHIELKSPTNFQLGWTILIFFDDVIDHTLAPPPCHRRRNSSS